MDVINGVGISTGNVSETYKAKKKQEPVATEQSNSEIQTESEKHLSSEAWKSTLGIGDVKDTKKELTKAMLSGMISPRDYSALKVMNEKGNVQSENLAMLLSLVKTGEVNARTLKFICKDGMMHDGMEKDIRMICEAKARGIDPKDAYVPVMASREEALEAREVGDCFGIEGEDLIYIKTDEGKSEQLKLDKETFIKLFPPAERFANAQRNAADCYFVSAVNSIADNPYSRVTLFRCFEQAGDDVKVNIPTSDYTYTAENGEMPKTYKKNYVTGCTGMKLIEHTYGLFLDDMVARDVKTIQTQKIDEMKSKLETTTDKEERQTLEARIKTFETTLQRYEEDRQSDKPQYVIERDSFRKVVADERNGVNLQELERINYYRKTSYGSPGDFYRGDGGYMEDVLIDFGFPETHACKTGDETLSKLLQNPEEAKNYIFSGGTKNQGKHNFLRAELIMDRSLSMYGCHAYRIIPSTDDKGNTIYKVSNPWNSSHNSILTYDQLNEFFCEIHYAKVK